MPLKGLFRATLLMAAICNRTAGTGAQCTGHRRRGHGGGQAAGAAAVEGDRPG